VQRYYDAGHSSAVCRQRFDIAYGAWAMAIRRGKLRLAKEELDGRRRYEWAAVQEHYDQGHSVRECMRRFGFCCAAWQKAVRRGEMKPRPLARPLRELLASGKARANIKRRLLRAGLLQNRCEVCDITEWLGEPLIIQIDHINGVRGDYRLENLRMLCPNCHSQTGTYGRKKRGSARLQEGAGSV
jgi:5-methylcytosine-specific restriction endonuclease McrA